MAYSETSVLVGGFAHVAIIIGLLYFLNNLTKKRSYITVSTQTVIDKPQVFAMESRIEPLQETTNIPENLKAKKTLNLSNESVGIKEIKLEAAHPNKGLHNEHDSDSAEPNEIETRLKIEVERLEAEAELNRITKRSENMDSSNERRISKSINDQSFDNFNPWTLAAIAVMAIGGGVIFFSNSSSRQDENLSERSSIEDSLIFKTRLNPKNRLYT